MKNSLTYFFISFISCRAFSICGADNVCCRVAKSTTESLPVPSTSTSTTQRTTSTTTHRKGLINFNLGNITNFFSTVLKPVPSTNFDNKPKPPQNLQKCVSRKGKKIEKRILIDEDDDEGDESALSGETAFAEFPWMLEILKKNRKTGIFEYKCGGVLSEFLK